MIQIDDRSLRHDGPRDLPEFGTASPNTTTDGQASPRLPVPSPLQDDRLPFTAPPQMPWPRVFPGL